MNSDDYNYCMYMGCYLSKLGREEEAIGWFDKALKIKLDDYSCLRNRGISLYKLERVEEAIQWFDRALKIKPDDCYSALFMGLSLSKLGREEEAINSFDTVLKIKPDDYNSLRNIGLSLSKLGREKEAIEFFDRALKTKPDDYNSLRYKGLSLSKLGREKQAIELFDHALEIRTNDYSSLRYKGLSLSKLGLEEEAIEWFDRVLNIKPDNYYTLRNKGISLYKLGREEEAIEWFNRALKIKPDDYYSRIYKSYSLYKLGREEETIEWHDISLKIEPDDCYSLREKGISLSKLGRQKEAIELFDQALKIKPDDWWTLVEKAFSLEIIGENEQANKIYDSMKNNLDRINDEKIIEIVHFKISVLRGKKDKKKDVLNEVLNYIRQQSNFFEDVNHIESKFNEFTNSEKKIPEDFCSFLSVLRKWNSYTPILPSENGDNKGGGYFLYHQGKGIVIDPGFNFIENFYQEGFKVADIDAVLITHAHNDHTVDLESIVTLVNRHNKAIKEAVEKEMKDKKEDEIRREITKRLKEKGKKIDLFINVGTFMKYSGWLNLKDSNEINSVNVLMANTEYKLAKEYHDITIYTTKAKHDEIIDEKYAIGFILDIKGVKIGFTGDTGWDWDCGEIMVKPFKDLKPQLVVAHLGSVKTEEFEYANKTSDAERNECFYRYHLGLLGITKFLEETKPELTIVSEFGEELRGKRKLIVESISKALNSDYPSEKRLCLLPGDIGLHIRLCDLNVHCFIEEDFVDYKSIEVYTDNTESGSNLCFHRPELDHQIFNLALDRKHKRKSPISLAKRTKSYISSHK